MQMCGTDWWLGVRGGVMNWEIETGINILAYVKWVASGNLLYSTGSSARWLIYFALWQKLAQY